MIPRTCRVTAAAATTALLVTLATLTACTDSPGAKATPTPVSLAQAADVLSRDGQKIANLLQAKSDEIDDRTSTDNPKGCPSGTARRTFTIKITDQLGEDVHEELVSAIGYANRRVATAGYQRLRDANRTDSSGGEVLATEFRKPTVMVSFTVTVWASGTESVRSITGRTDCMR